MHHLQLAALSILASQVSARALQSLVKRDPADVVVNENGNTAINFNDATISFGTLNPVDVINTLYDNCYDQGDCNGSPYQLTTTVPSTGYGTEDVALTVTIETGFFTPWVKNGMIEAAVAAAQNSNVAKTYDATVINSPSCETCPVYTDSLGQYTFPQSISISYDPTGSDHSVITVGFSIALPTTPGFCQTFTSFTSALISPIDAATGGALSLIGSFCGV